MAPSEAPVKSIFMSNDLTTRFWGRWPIWGALGVGAGTPRRYSATRADVYRASVPALPVCRLKRSHRGCRSLGVRSWPTRWNYS